MSSLVNEHESFQGVNGKPLVGGSIYIGVAGSDPEVSPQTIYSDSALSTAIANPQTLDSYGRSANKIYTSGRYSIKIKDSSGVQAYQNLNAGQDEAGGVSTLSNVQGTNTITAETLTGVTSLTDKELYVFKAAAANTAAVTLQVDSITAKDITYQGNNLSGGEFAADQNIIVQYSSTDDDFILIAPLPLPVFKKGADIASAAELPTPTDGNYHDVTGTTAITSIATSGRVGTVRKLHFDDVLTLTHHATDLVLPNGENITTVAGGEAELVEYATGDWRLTNYSPNRITLGTEQTTTSGTTIDTAVSSGAKRKKLMLEGVSINGTSDIILRLGDSGGVETSGYEGAGGYIAASTNLTENITSGVLIGANADASTTLNGTIELVLKDATNNTWSITGLLSWSNTTLVSIFAATKSLSGELTTVQLTTVGGTATFDAGSINDQTE